MANFRGTIFFRGGDQGWTENYYVTGNSNQDAMDLMLPMMELRRNGLATDCVVAAVRTSNVDTPRDSLINSWPSSGVGSKPGLGTGYGEAAPTNQPGDAVCVELTGSPSKKGRIFLRGLPDETQSGGKFVTNADYRNGMFVGAGSWATFITGNVFRIRTKGPDGFIYTPITGIAIKHLTFRKCGRPFGLRPGRR